MTSSLLVVQRLRWYELFETKIVKLTIRLQISASLLTLNNTFHCHDSSILFFFKGGKLKNWSTQQFLFRILFRFVLFHFRYPLPIPVRDHKAGFSLTGRKRKKKVRKEKMFTTESHHLKKNKQFRLASLPASSIMQESIATLKALNRAAVTLLPF